MSDRIIPQNLSLSSLDDITSHTAKNESVMGSKGKKGGLSSPVVTCHLHHIA